jgi:hypothetical protein
MLQTEQCFFPTRLAGPPQKQERTFQVMRKPQEQRSYRTLETEPSHSNMFRMETIPRNNYMTIERPVGGAELFRKMEQAARERDYRKGSKRSNKDYSQRNINSSLMARPRQERADTDPQPLHHLPTNNSVDRHIEEMYKSHVTCFEKPHKTRAATQMSKQPHRSEHLLRTAAHCRQKEAVELRREGAVELRREGAGELRREEQCQNYQDKMALLNEINYQRPLVEIYGDRYFEYILRNRYEEDLKPPPYIYNLRSRPPPQPKVISRLRSNSPPTQSTSPTSPNAPTSSSRLTTPNDSFPIKSPHSTHN